MNYGMPYKGSKNKIALQIINRLPSGKRLVDLFGGGGAVTHCASLVNKWNTVHYNEFNPLCHDLFTDAISGKYNPKIFTPEWISRDKFNELKKTDGYVKYIWSFGNNGRDYLFSKEREEYKRVLHNAVVFNDLSEIDSVLPGFGGFGGAISVHDRRLIISKHVIATRKAQGLGDSPQHRQLQQLQQLEQLQRLEQLEQLERLQQLIPIAPITTTCLDYRNVELLPSDIVYCDPPYANTEKYDKANFNHEEFWQWVKECPNPVYISEYTAPANMQVVHAMERLCLMNAHQKRPTRIEKLYWNSKK